MDDDDIVKRMDELDGVDGVHFVENEDLIVITSDIKTRICLYDKNNVYRNFSSPKGSALIINNKEFKNKQNERKGTEHDEKMIQSLLTKLGYDVQETQHILTAEGMREAAKKFATNEAHKSCDSCVVVVLSHGEYDSLCGTDGKHLNIHEFIDCFNAINAPHLRGKPKLFFIQACRGDKIDFGAVFADSVDGTNFENDTLKDSKQSTNKKYPIGADILIAYATTPHFLSYRNPTNGTWFIQSICKVFSQHAKDENIYSLLTKVNERVASSYETNEKKQMPQFVSNLRKQFYFFPGDDNIFAVHQGPDEVVSNRFMETEAIVKHDGEVFCKTTLVAKHFVWGFRGAVQIQAYTKNNVMIWKSGWRVFGVNLHKESTREWSEKISADVLSIVDSIVIVHKHHYEIKDD